MIKSMTGFGRATFDNGKVQISVEVKSLNSKFLDLNLRLPKIFSEKELELRNLVSEKLERGKVSVNIEFQRYAQNEIAQIYNEPLFIAYYTELKKLADRVVGQYDQLFELALNSPDVIQSKLQDELPDETLLQFKETLISAIDRCDEFRTAEGKSLQELLIQDIQSIQESLKKVDELDPMRVQRIRDKIKGSVTSVFGEDGYDPNRLEQEIIFYIEKLDINEEKKRLQMHLNFFQNVLNEMQSNGKKLGFISQEIGREINTIGSKCNDAEIQKHVVVMKEELEKIKEQLNNVL